MPTGQTRIWLCDDLQTNCKIPWKLKKRLYTDTIEVKAIGQDKFDAKFSLSKA